MVIQLYYDPFFQWSIWVLVLYAVLCCLEFDNSPWSVHLVLLVEWGWIQIQICPCWSSLRPCHQRSDCLHYLSMFFISSNRCHNLSFCESWILQHCSFLVANSNCFNSFHKLYIFTNLFFQSRFQFCKTISEITIFTDSQAALKALESVTVKSSQVSSRMPGMPQRTSDAQLSSTGVGAGAWGHLGQWEGWRTG